MRTFVVDQTMSLQSLSKQLIKGADSAAAGTLERLKAMNPHVNFNKIEPGTVLLVPDVPGIKTNAGVPVAANPLDSLVTEIENGMKAAIKRAKSGYEQRTADRKVVAVALKTRTLSTLIDGDPMLSKQVSQVEAAFKADDKSATTVQAQLKAVQEQAMKDLQRLKDALG